MSDNKIVAGLMIVALFGISAFGSWAYVKAAEPSSSPTAFGFSENRFGRFGGKGMGMMGGMGHGGRGAPWRMEMSAETEALFDQLREAQQAGDTDRVARLRQDLDAQFKADRQQRESEMNAAIERGYASWKEYVSGLGLADEMLSVITEDNFDQFKKLHQLRQEARALEEELGLNEMGMHHMRF
jgi:hypothetical protein